MYVIIIFLVTYISKKRMYTIFPKISSIYDPQNMTKKGPFFVAKKIAKIVDLQYFIVTREKCHFSPHPLVDSRFQKYRTGVQIFPISGQTKILFPKKSPYLSKNPAIFFVNEDDIFFRKSTFPKKYTINKKINNNIFA